MPFSDLLSQLPLDCVMQAPGDSPCARKAGCRGCRISKVKCDLFSCSARVCTRCARLGLACIENPPSQQGRRKMQDTTSRLSPAVRALLVRPPNALQPANAPSSPTDSRWTTSPSYPMIDSARNALCRYYCDQINGMGNLASREFRIECVRMAFMSARSSGDWEMTSAVMGMARHLQLSMDEAIIAMAEGSATSSMVPKGDPILPGFIAEWQYHSGVPAVTSFNWYGKACTFPNECFRRLYASGHNGDTSALDAVSGLNPEVTNSRTGEALYLDLLETGDMKRALTNLYLKALADVDRTASHTRYIEITSDDPLRMSINGKPTNWVRPKLRFLFANKGAETFYVVAWPGMRVIEQRPLLENFPKQVVVTGPSLSVQACTFATSYLPPASGNSNGNASLLGGSCGATVGVVNGSVDSAGGLLSVDVNYGEIQLKQGSNPASPPALSLRHVMHQPMPQPIGSLQQAGTLQQIGLQQHINIQRMGNLQHLGNIQQMGNMQHMGNVQSHVLSHVQTQALRFWGSELGRGIGGGLDGGLDGGLGDGLSGGLGSGLGGGQGGHTFFASPAEVVSAQQAWQWPAQPPRVAQPLSVAGNDQALEVQDMRLFETLTDALPLEQLLELYGPDAVQDGRNNRR